MTSERRGWSHKTRSNDGEALQHRRIGCRARVTEPRSASFGV